VGRGDQAAGGLGDRVRMAGYAPDMGRRAYANRQAAAIPTRGGDATWHGLKALALACPPAREPGIRSAGGA